MIVKMKFVSATGPREQFDDIVDKYLTRYDMHLENAYNEFRSDNNVIPYSSSNPYKDVLNKAENLLEYIKDDVIEKDVDITSDQAFNTIKSLNKFYISKTKPVEELTEEKRQLQISLDKILPFVGLKFDVEKLLKFQFIRYRFGRIPKAYWNNFATHFKSDLSSIFAKCQETEDYIYGVYFVPKVEHDDVDAAYASMHFERIFMPDEYKGTPTHASEKIQKRIETINKKIEKLNFDLFNRLEEEREMLYFSYKKILSIYRNYDVRKLSACTKNQKYFIVCGWMAEDDAKRLSNDLQEVNDCIVQVDDVSEDCKPPTELKNPKMFKPFELYIKNVRPSII